MTLMIYFRVLEKWCKCRAERESSKLLERRLCLLLAWYYFLHLLFGFFETGSMWFLSHRGTLEFNDGKWNFVVLNAVYFIGNMLLINSVIVLCVQRIKRSAVLVLNSTNNQSLLNSYETSITFIVLITISWFSCRSTDPSFNFHHYV